MQTHGHPFKTWVRSRNLNFISSSHHKWFLTTLKWEQLLFTISWMAPDRVLESLRVRGMPLQVYDDSWQLREVPSQTSVFAFKQPPILSVGVHFKRWRIVFWGLIMNQWLSEAENEHTDSLNSKLNMCCSFSNMKWVTVPVTHWGFVVEIEIRSCKNLGWVTVWSFLLLRGLYNAETSCLPNDIFLINLLFLDYLLYVIVDEWGQVGNKRKEGLEKVQRFQKDNI